MKLSISSQRPYVMVSFVSYKRLAYISALVVTVYRAVLKLQTLLMGSSEFSSQITDRFPEGIRVLVVDDDLTWLKILEKMLKKCNYQVTACSSARDALEMLRERKDGFEIVMCDANMPDMDGFQLLERVGNMNLPIIMMSVDGKTSRVMKGIQRGACDYLLKPIRMKEIQNIWQHVFRKRMNEERDIEHEKTAKSMDCHSFSGDISLAKKRKETDNRNHEVSSRKKARVVWTEELHQKFVKALDQIGLDKAGPKKIFDLMGEPWLTRENVASHLQKYRLYLSKSQRQHEQKVPNAATMHSDIHVQEPVPSVCLHNSIINHSFTLQQNVILDQHSPVVGYNPNNDTQICEVNEAKGALLEFEPQFQLQHQLYHLQPPPITSCIGGGADKPTLVHGLESSAAFFAFQQHQGHNNIAFEANPYENLGCSFKRSSMMGNGCAIRSSDEEFIGYPSQGDLYLPNHGNASLGCVGYMGQDLIQDIAPYRVDFNYGQQHPTSPWNAV